MKNIETKVKESFKVEFQMTAKVVTIENGFATLLSNENNTWYSCNINAKGVKNNSWRMN